MGLVGDDGGEETVERVEVRMKGERRSKRDAALPKHVEDEAIEQSWREVRKTLKLQVVEATGGDALSSSCRLDERGISQARRTKS